VGDLSASVVCDIPPGFRGSEPPFRDGPYRRNYDAALESAPAATDGVPQRFSGLSARVGFDHSRLRYVRHDQVVLGTDGDARIVADDADSLAARRLRAYVGDQ